VPPAEPVLLVGEAPVLLAVEVPVPQVEPAWVAPVSEQPEPRVARVPEVEQVSVAAVEVQLEQAWGAVVARVPQV